MLRPLRSYRRLSPAERRLALRALSLVVAFRIALWMLSAKRVLAAAPRRRIAARVPPERMAKLVRAAARRVTGASCLTRALACRWLLAEASLEATLHFGHRRDEQGRFAAHAWLDHDGRVVLGGDEDLSLYHRFEASPTAGGPAPPAFLPGPTPASRR